MTSTEVWDALLADMPMAARIRNLATMTRAGVLSPGSAGTSKVVTELGNDERIRRARVHPVAIMAALRTYAAGRGPRGRNHWNPVREVVDALDAAFYTAFANVEPAGKRLLLALDVSSSMTWGDVGGVPGLTPRDASAALALVTASIEPHYETVGFFAGKRGWKAGRRPRKWYLGADGLTPLPIGPRQRLDDAGSAGLPPGVGHRRAAGRGRHGLERLLDRRSGRSRDARTSSASTRRRRS